MNISPFYMKHFTHNTLLYHIQSSQFKEVIDTIFKLHTMLASFFRSIDQFPYFIKSHSCRNLNRYMFAMFHRIHSHFSMMFPIRDNIHKVDIIPFTKFFPCIFLSTIRSSFGQTCFFQYFL